MSQESFEKNASREERIQQLIDSGEAVDATDAADILKEEGWRESFRGYNRERALAKIGEFLGDLDRARGAGERLSPDEEADRHDMRFHLAVIASARDLPDEREFLLYQYFLDIIGSDFGDGEERLRYESIKRRLERKAQAVAERIGIERARDLLAAYRTKLKELFRSY